MHLFLFNSWIITYFFFDFRFIAGLNMPVLCKLDLYNMECATCVYLIIICIRTTITSDDIILYVQCVYFCILYDSCGFSETRKLNANLYIFWYLPLFWYNNTSVIMQYVYYLNNNTSITRLTFGVCNVYTTKELADKL